VKSYYDSLGASLDPTPRIRKRSGPFSTEEQLKTVAEAVAFCERNGLDPAEVTLAHNYVRWESPETPEEVERRISGAESARREHLDFIRKAYREYAERGLLGEEEP
jgi:hypothetical protein